MTARDWYFILSLLFHLTPCTWLYTCTLYTLPAGTMWHYDQFSCKPVLYTPCLQVHRCLHLFNRPDLSYHDLLLTACTLFWFWMGPRRQHSDDEETSTNYSLCVFLRERHHFVLYVPNGNAAHWHKVYSFITVDQQTNKCCFKSFQQQHLPNHAWGSVWLYYGNAPFFWPCLRECVAVLWNAPFFWHAPTVVLGPIWTNLVPNIKLTFFFKNSLKWST